MLVATVLTVLFPLMVVVEYSWSESDFPGIWPTHGQGETELLKVSRPTRKRAEVPTAREMRPITEGRPSSVSLPQQIQTVYISTA